LESVAGFNRNQGADIIRNARPTSSESAIDALREQELLKLINIIQRLSAHLAPELVAAIEAEATPIGGPA